MDGFKSFYTRTTLRFEPGITAIVGPNGCGKSNTLDAVRWVLGEQSPTQLRGEQIADVISDGNTRRNPKRTGRAQLTFDEVGKALDQDRDELAVAREVDREGTGSYYVNGDEARLKDIKEIFRDTGVGQDLYSLIGQGDIRDLVESNPEERREILEEAAGVASYRHRRDRSRRRLDSTREDFEVIDQQLQEKQGRLNQLKGQAEKAQEFRTLQGECRTLEREEKRRRILALSDKLDGRGKEVEARKQKHQQAKAGLEESQQSRNRLQQRTRRLQHGLDLVESNHKQVSQDLERARQQQVRQDTSLQSRREQLQREKRSRSEELDSLHDDLSELSDQTLDQRNQHLQEQIAGQEAQFLRSREGSVRDRVQELNDKLEASRDRSLFDVGEEQQVKHQARQLSQQREELENQVREHRQGVDEAGEEAREAYRSIISLTEQGLDVARRREEMRRRHRVQQRRADMLESLGQELQQRRDQLTQRLEKRRDKRETLQRLHGEYQGFYDGVQAIMTRVEEGQFEGVLGVVANLIEVPGSLEKAIQVALGAKLQNIVVQRQEQVSPMVEYLKHNDAGRATFLPLDSLRPSNVPREARGLTERQGVVGFADQLIEYPDSIDQAVQYLLARVLVVEELEVGLALQRDGHLSGWGGLVVSKDGEKVQSSGPVTGGTVNPRHGQLLTRSDKLDELGEEVEQLESSLEDLEPFQKMVRADHEKAQEQLQRMSNALHGMEDEIRRLGQQRRQVKQDFSMVRQQLRTRYMELVENVHQRRRTRLQDQAYAELSRLVEQREQRRQQETKSVRKKRDRWNQRQELLADQRRGAERREDRSRSRVEDLSARCKRIRQRCQRHQQQIKQTQEELRRIRTERRQERRELARQQFAVRRYEQLTAAWQDLRNDLSGRQRELQNQLEDANQDLQDAQREVEQARSQLETAQNRVGNLKERLAEQIDEMAETLEVEELSLEKIEQMNPEEDVPEETDKLREHLREKRAELQNLRPVNMLADKQAEELEEEVEDLREQREDLETACDQLERLIDRLNRRARQQFKEAFEEIQDHFTTYVRDLFQGGEGHLRLSDDPILEAGVELEVQPPGESLKRMSALSGGEKSMAAIAFLFSLFERKTTPFCFLDEVDAALDDQNLSRFVNLLHQFEDKTQFIVITHKKITMQAAAQLYGVTMSESGVSEIVGMNLEEAERFQEKAQA